MTAIILRKDLKNNITPKEYELVLATDTEEIGYFSKNRLIWQKWDLEINSYNFIKSGEGVPLNSLGNDGELYIRTDTFEEYRKKNGSWVKINWGITDESILDNFEPNWHNAEDFPYLGKYSYDMKETYSPQNGSDVAVKENFNELEVNHVNTSGTKNFKEDYVPTQDRHVITHGFLRNNLIKIPDSDPCIEGTFWNDNGEIKFSDCGLKMIVKTNGGDAPRVYAYGGNIKVNNIGENTYQVSGSSSIYYFRFDQQDNITEIEILKTPERLSSIFRSFQLLSSLETFKAPYDAFKNVTHFELAWQHCSSLTSFPVLDVSNGVDFRYAWHDCSSLTSFPQLDVSNGTNFTWTWASCSSLTSFPVLDVSNGTNFSGTWGGCSSLTSFPQLDVSNGTNFRKAWQYCSSLTSFPVLDVSNGTNFSGAWEYCSSLTSFPVIDVSKGTDFSYAWQHCSSLTSFPVLNVSNGTNFLGTWEECSSLTSFPQLDVSSGTNFIVTWASCSSLTSFPQLDVSSGTNFSFTWNNCYKLPHCPAGNEVIIPSGANTMGICYNCCTG